jgi:hypothetical protein
VALLNCEVIARDYGSSVVWVAELSCAVRRRQTMQREVSLPGSALVAGIAVLILAGGSSLLEPAAGASAPAVPATVYDHTGLRLADIVWTGRRFLYVENTTNAVWAAGSPPTTFASMPKVVEETRCVLSPGAHGFPAGYLFCHAPDNVLYRIKGDGTVSVFARLPDTSVSDGALAFDTIGRFGFRLLAATGRSGSTKKDGGAVFGVTAAGAVSSIGRYSASTGGGADEIVLAPSRFGAGSGQAVLTVDAGKNGALVMMDAHGSTREIATLPEGPNPIVAVPTTRVRPAPGGVRPGLYVTDTNSTNVFYAPASKLSAYAGSLIVGSELGAHFWAVSPNGRTFRSRRIPLTLPGSKFNLEGAKYVG